MSIKKDDTDDYVSFYAYDSTDHITSKTGLSSFTVYYSLNNGAATAMTTPTVAEKDATNMPGWYHLLVDEAGMVSAEGELNLDIKATGMDNVPLKIDIIGNTTKEIYDRVGAPVGASISADLVVIDNFVDELESRLSAIRAGYLDNLSAGAVALASGVDLTKIHGVALTETVNGYLAAAFVKLFDVATPLLVASEVMRGTDSALTTKTGFALSATGADLILKNSTFALAIADAVADEEYTGTTHNVVNSLARRVREIGAFAIHSGTAQAGTSHSITLAATADSNDGIYNRNLIVLVDNTGVGQTRTIVDYDGTTKIAIIDRDWRVSPDATTAYQITPDDTALVVDQGAAQAGTSTTITLRSYASAVDDNYLCNIIVIIAGTGRGQARLVGSYDGGTKIVTICGDNWVTTPDATSVYAMMPYGTACTSCVGDYAQSQIVAAIIAGIADGSYDLQEMMRIIFASVSGKSAGGGTVTVTMRDAADGKDRITATVDATGNRIAVIRDGS